MQKRIKKRSYLWKEAYEHNTNKKDILRLHRIFNSMKDRCYNLLSKDFPNYGGRGIKIYDEWLLDLNSFVNWAFLNGYKENLSIDRINVNEDYKPDNCRWITLFEQADNKRTSIYINYNGEKRTFMSVLREKGIKNNYSLYRSRILRCGWDIEKAIKTPIRTSYRKIILNAILDYFSENKDMISIPKLSEKINLSASSIYKYLHDPEFIRILETNNIIRVKGVGLECKSKD